MSKTRRLAALRGGRASPIRCGDVSLADGAADAGEFRRISAEFFGGFGRRPRGGYAPKSPDPNWLKIAPGCATGNAPADFLTNSRNSLFDFIFWAYSGRRAPAGPIAEGRHGGKYPAGGSPSKNAHALQRFSVWHVGWDERCCGVITSSYQILTR